MKIKAYELIDHGIEHNQYFQGCGTSFTKFTHVWTGVGDSSKEAYEDAVDPVSYTHLDVYKRQSWWSAT